MKILLLFLFVCFTFSASRWHEAGNFFAISRSSGMTVNFVQLSEQDEDEDSSVPVLRALEQIKDFEVDIILLYIEKQKIELMLQQVVLIYISLIVISVLFLTIVIQSVLFKLIIT